MELIIPSICISQMYWCSRFRWRSIIAHNWQTRKFRCKRMNGPLILRVPFDLAWAWFCRILNVIESFLQSGIIFPSEHSALLELGPKGLKSDRPERKDASSLLQKSWWKRYVSTLPNQQVPVSRWDCCGTSWEVLVDVKGSGNCPPSSPTSTFLQP